MGAETSRQRENRRGFVNENGALGDLRRDEDDRVRNTDGYVQVNWAVVPAVSVLAGVRVSSVSFRAADHYVTGANPDDSGERDFHHTNPVAGAVWRIGEGVSAYASHGEGFETPTFAELAYRPSGPGLNLALDASTSRANEVGVKAVIAGRHRVNIAAFATDTDDEIVVNSATGGRTTFRNAGPTRRRGVEASGRRTGAAACGHTSPLRGCAPNSRAISLRKRLPSPSVRGRRCRRAAVHRLRRARVDARAAGRD